MKATLELTEVYVRVIPHWKGLRTALYRKVGIAFMSYRVISVGTRKRLDAFPESSTSYFLKAFSAGAKRMVGGGICVCNN